MTEPETFSDEEHLREHLLQVHKYDAHPKASLQWVHASKHREIECWVGIDPETPEDLYRAVLDPQDRWNGWANPRFDRAEAERVVSRMTSRWAHLGPDAMPMRWEGDVIVITSYPGTDEEEEGRVEAGPDGRYAIGNYGWTWSEYDIPEGVDPAEALRRDHAETEIYIKASNEKNQEQIAAGIAARERYAANREAANAAVRAAGGPWREKVVTDE